MKRFFATLIIVTALFTDLKAQQPVAQDLNQVSLSAIECRNSLQIIRLSLKSLAIDYFVNQNPSVDPSGYLAVVNNENESLENAIDDLLDHLFSAQQNNPNLDISTPEQLVDQLIQDVESISEESEDLAQFIQAGEVSAAISTGQFIRATIAQALETCRDIALDAQALKATHLPVPTYDVRIILEDSFGNKITGNTGLQGFYAINQETDEIFYSGEFQTQDIDLFVHLPEGTYEFGAFNGVFDGASSTLIVLSDALVLNANGEVEVALIYWSE